MGCGVLFFFFQAEDGIRDFCLSRGLGDVYKRQIQIYSVYSACPLKYPIAASRQLVLLWSVMPVINTRRSIVAVVHQSVVDTFGCVISAEFYKTYRLFTALRRDCPIFPPVVHSKLITEFSERIS